MQLAEFIESEIEQILREWEDFAGTIWPAEGASPAELRDHAGELLRAIAEDMRAPQNSAEQKQKSKGHGDTGSAGKALSRVSRQHSKTRAGSGLDLSAIIAEYRALRASVVRLWQKRTPALQPGDIDDLTRFNEAIDQVLTESVQDFTDWLDRSRQMLLAIVGHDLRAPLNAINLSAQALQENGLENSGQTALVEQILTSSEAMATMLHDFLDFTHTRMGCALSLNPTDADLNALTHEVAAEARAAHPEHSIEVSTQGDLTGRWDFGRLRQLLSNLVNTRSITATNIIRSVSLRTRKAIR